MGSSPIVRFLNKSTHSAPASNLVEAHVLRVIPQQHHIRLDKVRTALDYLEQPLGLSHPLARAASKQMEWICFVESVGKLIDVSKDGQLAMEKTLQHILKRIEWDEQGLVTRLFPLTRGGNAPDSPKVLVIDVRISFGRPYSHNGKTL
ncbi:MAG: hypothetical protein WCD18_12850 [Thermosynechococcaceae cyanobacterium]